MQVIVCDELQLTNNELVRLDKHIALFSRCETAWRRQLL